MLLHGETQRTLELAKSNDFYSLMNPNQSADAVAAVMTGGEEKSPPEDNQNFGDIK